MNKAFSFVAGLFVGAALFLLGNFIWYNVLFQKGLIFVVNKISCLLANVVMLIFVALCGVDIIPMNMLGWIILCLFATLNCAHVVFDFFKKED